MHRLPEAALGEGTHVPEHWARVACEFVRSIGIPVEVTEESAALAGGFLPEIQVANGGLVVDVTRVFPGDILHEAGHLAVIPAVFRAKASGHLEVVHATMSHYLQTHIDDLMSSPEDPVCRGIMQSDDPEATAWQYAAAQAIGLPDEWLFPKDAFDGDAASILAALRARQYLGINGLQAAGWTVCRRSPRRDVPEYPELAFWLHGGPAA